MNDKLGPRGTSTAAPTITIIGCGYVGLTTAAILANCGVKVFALEINPKRLAAIASGRSFFHEQGINELLTKALADGNLIATDDYAQAIPASSIVFSCVGTPDKPDGSADLGYVFDSAQRALPLMAEGTIYVQKSTVPVGTGQQIMELIKATNASVRYVSNPEFLREGTAISDSLWFDRIIAGGNDADAAGVILNLYRRIEAGRDHVASVAQLSAPDHNHIPDARYTATSLSSAELIKVSANAFLALKISFANSIAKLADATDADINEVMDGVGADHRIGRAFLNAGRGYGGGCFPKDVSSLIRSAEDYGVEMDVMDAAANVNASMPHYIIHKAGMAYGKQFTGQEIAVLGLAFKPGTSDIRRSPGITIANTLAVQGAKVRVFDPQAMDEAAESLHKTIQACSNLQEAVKGASCVFVTTGWPEFCRLKADPALSKAFESVELVVDCMNCIDVSTYPAGIKYVGVGRTPRP